MSLKSPFPYYGGKSRFASVIWDRFGCPQRYIEPFAGSLAVLLGNSNYADTFEIVSDINGYICNFWRAIVNDPEQTAYWAQYPTIHQDLSARQYFLHDWLTRESHRLDKEPDYFDVKVAGWWCWGMSNWIGPLYAEPRNCEDEFNDKRPLVIKGGGGVGTQTQRKFNDKRPHVKPHPSSSGTSSQTRSFKPSHQRPQADMRGAGHGTSSQTVRFNDLKPHTQARDIPVWQSEYVYEWFDQLAARLSQVIVFNRDWTSFISPSILANTDTQVTETALFMDPPYRQDNDRSVLYQGDKIKASHDVAIECYKWCVEQGEKYRIAYACHDGDFEIPSGWTAETLSFGGVKRDERKETVQDMVMFSPRCHQPEPDSLFGD